MKTKMAKTQKKKHRPLWFNEEAHGRAEQRIVNFLEEKDDFEKSYGIQYPCTDPVHDTAEVVREQNPDMKHVPNDEALLTLFNLNPVQIRTRFNLLARLWREIPEAEQKCVTLQPEQGYNGDHLKDLHMEYPLNDDEAELHKLSNEFSQQFELFKNQFAEKGYPYLWQHLLQDVVRGNSFNWNTWVMWVRRPMKERLKEEAAA